MPYSRYPRPVPRRSRGNAGSPAGARPQGPAAPAPHGGYGIYRVTGQPGGNGSPLQLELSAREGEAVLPDPSGLSLTLAPGRLYWVSLLVRGTPERALDSFDQGVLTVTPLVDSVPQPAASSLLPSEGSSLPVSVSAAFLIPPSGAPLSFSLLAETAGAGAEVSGFGGALSILAFQGCSREPFPGPGIR